MQTIPLSEAQAHLAALVEEAIRGKTIMIESHGRQIQLVPHPTAGPKPQFGSAQGQIGIADDFDEPLTDVAPEGTAARPTPFWARVAELAAAAQAEAIAHGDELLDADGVNRELAARRGGLYRGEL